VRELVKLGLVLAVVCAVTAGVLAAVNSAVQGRIEENNRLEAIRKRQEVFPAARDFEARTVAGRSIFVATGEGGAPLGLVVTAAPRGYAGPIGLTIGIAPDGTVAGLAISKLDQTETPGLGVKVTLASFRDQFRGRGAAAVRLKKDGGTVDAITAATISSRAVAAGVREALGWYGKNFPQGPGGPTGG
jgi:Na+-translocating ferredoxin:NAD+ oxidoreductase subunit G